MSDENNEPRIKNALENRRNYSNSSALEFKYNEQKLKEENKYRVKGEAFPQDVNCFNWGACIVTPIWGLCNNSPIACLSLVLGFIPFVGWLLCMIFSIYCGVKGNEWAWAKKDWPSLQEFHRVQKLWALWAIGIEVAIIIISVVVFSVAMNSISNVMDNYL